MRHLLLVVLAAVSSAGTCSYGGTVEKFAPASSVRGVSARVTMADTVLHGELLEVQPTGLLLLAATTPGRTSAAPPDCRLQVVPFSSVRAAQFEGLGGDYEIAGPQPGKERLERLRLVSRFPHGLAPPVLKQLLESCRQTEVAGVEP